MRRICLREQALLTQDERNEQPKKEAKTSFEMTSVARSRTAFAMLSNGLRVLSGGTNGLHAYFFAIPPGVGETQTRSGGHRFLNRAIFRVGSFGICSLLEVSGRLLDTANCAFV